VDVAISMADKERERERETKQDFFHIKVDEEDLNFAPLSG
jgi:hypothetical protein